MRLRSIIRPPERYMGEDFYMPFTKKSGRSRRQDDAPHYVDYDPNLPPAAFPTLDSPRAPGLDKNRHKVGQRNDSQDSVHDWIGYQSSSDDDDEHRPWKRIKLEAEDDLPSHTDNYVANKDDMDLLRMGNMSWMTTASELSREMDMSDSDTEGHDKDIERDCDPQWSDIAPQLQTEIFENILRHNSWSAVCNMLELTAQEEQTLQDHFSRRDMQRKSEDFGLDEMRNIQLNALLSIDNSKRCDETRHESVFRSISRQSILSSAEDKGLDYFSCRENELSKATQFLQNRGIDLNATGKWSNAFNILPTPNPMDTGSLRTSDCGGCRQITPSPHSTDSNEGNQDIGNQSVPTTRESLTRGAGTASTPGVQVLQMCRSDRTGLSERSRSHQQWIRDSGPISQPSRTSQFEIHPLEGAKIPDAEQHYNPIEHMSQPERMNNTPFSSALDRAMVDPRRDTSQMLHQMTAPAAQDSPQLLRRTTRDDWPYSPVRLRHRPATSSMRCQFELRAAQYQLQIRRMLVARTVLISNAPFQPSRRSLLSVVQSLPLSPEFISFNTMASIRPQALHETESHETSDSPTTSPISTCGTNLTPPTADSPDDVGIHDWDEDEGGFDDDEMVLVGEDHKQSAGV